MSLEVTHVDSVVTLRLNRPEQFNALDAELTFGLVEELRATVTRDDVRVIVVTGTGVAFSAGADLEGEDPAAKYDHRAVDAAATLVDAVIACDRPVVCGLNGIAAGVGMSLALACDLIVATESAALTLAFTQVGLMPDGGATATVAASVGRARAMRLALTSDVIGAQEALAAGLITHVLPDADYEEGLAKIVRRLAQGPPLAFAATKKAINAATIGDLDRAHAREHQGQPVLLRSADAVEGMRAFVQKRRPVFGGS